MVRSKGVRHKQAREEAFRDGEGHKSLHVGLPFVLKAS